MGVAYITFKWLGVVWTPTNLFFIFWLFWCNLVTPKYCWRGWPNHLCLFVGSLGHSHCHLERWANHPWIARGVVRPLPSSSAAMCCKYLVKQDTLCETIWSRIILKSFSISILNAWLFSHKTLFYYYFSIFFYCSFFELFLSVTSLLVIHVQIFLVQIKYKPVSYIPCLLIQDVSRKYVIFHVTLLLTKIITVENFRV